VVAKSASGRKRRVGNGVRVVGFGARARVVSQGDVTVTRVGRQQVRALQQAARDANPKARKRTRVSRPEADPRAERAGLTPGRAPLTSS